MPSSACAEVLAQFGIGVTRGAICSPSQSTGTDLVPTQRKLLDTVAEADMVVMDETGWRICGAGVWLWVATAPNVTVYDIADGRSFEDACRLVPDDYKGTLVRDGWVVYPCYDKATHQTCTAHLLCRCDEMISDNPAWARGVPRQVRKLLLDALAARDCHADKRAEIVADLAELVKLLADEPHLCDANRRLINHVASEHESGALFTFLERGNIDATNWRAEQAIRTAYTTSRCRRHLLRTARQATFPTWIGPQD